MHCRDRGFRDTHGRHTTQEKHLGMKKKTLIPIVAVIVVLVAGVAWLTLSLVQQRRANHDMEELVELNKLEMENEYQRFADQYSELITSINNDSLVAQLTEEQLKTQRLLQELKEVKASNAREITRLKKELATCRAVIRSYVIEIDSLNRLNQDLMTENTRVKGQYEEATRQIEDLNADKQSLSEKVAIAAQLDAVNISMKLMNSKGKQVDKTKKAKVIEVSFNIAKNVTASNGVRTLYVRVTTPAGSVLSKGGTFEYENKNLRYSMKKAVEYTGEETLVTTYWNVDEFLSEGTYQVSIFAEGSMIGSRSFSFK